MSCSPKDLQPIFRGDTVPFDFAFTNPDGDPVDISGTTLVFTMTIDPSVYNAELNDLLVSVTFPADINSEAGLGTLLLSQDDTKDLRVNANYHYYFKWTQDEDIEFTVGLGRVKVLQNTIIT